MRCSAAATHVSTCVAGSCQPVESHLWPNLTGAQLSYARSSILTRSLELLYLPTRHLRSYLLYSYLLRAGAAPLGRAAQACSVTEPNARRARGGAPIAYVLHVHCMHTACTVHTTYTPPVHRMHNAYSLHVHVHAHVHRMQMRMHMPPGPREPAAIAPAPRRPLPRPHVPCVLRAGAGVC